MNNKDEEFEYLSNEDSGELDNGFEQPNYGNYEYNDSTQIPNTINENAQVATPNQNINKNTNNDKIINKMHDKHSGSDAYAKTLDNKNYYNDALAKNRKEQKELQRNLVDAKKENKDKQNTLDNKKKKVADKQKQLRETKKKNNNNESDGQGISSKIRNLKNRRINIGNKKSELKEAKKDEKKADKDKTQSDKKLEDEKNKLRKNREERKKLLKDKDKAEKFKARHPIQAAKLLLKNTFNKLKRIILLKVFLPVLLFIIIFAILVDAIYEAFEVVDNAITYAADVQEKMDNFFNGLGFDNSEDAFYAELDELQKEYNNEIDVPLLLSTLFYDDIQNNMDPSKVDLDVVTDDSSFLSFGAAYQYVKDYISEKIEESNVTVGKNGYKYSSNKIYRMRMLAKNMMTKAEKTETKTLHRHLLDVGKRIGKYITNLLDGGTILRALIDYLTFGLFEIPGLIEDIAGILNGSEVLETTDLYNTITHNLGKNIVGIVSAIFSLVGDVEDIDLCAGASTDTDGDGKNDSFDSGLVCVEVATYSSSSDNFFEYLKSDYIPKMPEFKKYLYTDDGTIKEKAIDNIINGIKDIYEDYKYYFESEPQNAEVYNENETGGISPLLLSYLRRPVDGTFTGFTGRDAFGIYNGKMQNGVVLTHSNSGINEGDNVYSVAKGKVTGIGRSSGEVEGNATYVLSSGYKTYNDMTEDQLKALASQCHAEQGVAGIEGVKAEASLMANLYEYKGGSATTIYDYVLNGDGTNGSWFSNSKRHMNPLCKNPSAHKDICTYINKQGYEVKVYYYEYADELEAVKDVFINGNRTLPVYIDEHDTLGDIDKIIVNGDPKTDRSSIEDKENYIANQTVLHNVYQSTYTFYTFPADKADPFGYKTATYNYYKDKVTNNVEENNSNWVKIDYTVNVEGSTSPFVFTVIYKYLGTISDNVKLGEYVEKGEVIGTVGKVYDYSEASLYFEFRDEHGTAINPTNLFISSLNSTLVGNSNKEKIWFYFLDNGFTKAGAAAILGNVIHESSFDPGVLEGTAASKSGYTSKQFTEEVDSGKISRNEFICSERFGIVNKKTGKYNSADKCQQMGLKGGSYGYGIFQFTYPTIKEHFAQHTIDVGVSISDLKTQMDSFIDYLSKNNSSLLNTLKTTESPEEAAKAVLLEYERPASITRSEASKQETIKARGESARKAYDDLKDLPRPAPVTTTDNKPSYPPGNYGLIWPTKSTNITSYYGNRDAPTAGASTNHKAIDIGGSIGDPIYASADGVVTHVDRTSARGIYVVIKHDNGFTTRYQHLNKALVTVNTRVSQGDTIAELGQTGIHTGPHVHFEVYTPNVTPELGYSSNASNPLDYVKVP